MNIKPKRYHSVDLLRGAIMVIMAIDHVRVYSGIPANSTDPAIFFTRWITHFCVSGFVFFAGTSAFLYGEKLNDKRALSRFLITRGIFLVILELTLLRFCWTFNLNFGQFMLAGVIWMLGWCMVLLAGAIWLPFRSIWIIGLLIIAGEQVFGLVPVSVHWWNFFYPIDYDGIKWISILYVLLPWLGVMMAGYGFGHILQMEAARRRKICLMIGLSAIAVFVIIGTLLIVTGDPKPRPFIFRLLGQQKYPPSQLYLLMTLGPIIALVPFAERAGGWLARVLSTFGRVPLFYYIVHILLIHVAALLVNLLRTGNMHQGLYDTAPYTEISDNLRWSLPLLYLVFILVEIILYFICSRYAKYKFQHPELKLLKYL